jgi:molybdenum cofactor cytidylyltransferase
MNSSRDALRVTNPAAIILAAGQSSRLGQPKQLLNYKGTTLLQHAIDVARQSSVRAIVVVLGSEFELIKDAIDATGTHLVGNENWQSGVASSIICGIDALNLISPSPDGAIFMVCDQPFVSSALLDELLAAQKATGKSIAASQYGDIVGIPALFHKSFFNRLQLLKGDTGAKKIIQQNPAETITVPFAQGGIDIDTLDDYHSLGK